MSTPQTPDPDDTYTRPMHQDDTVSPPRPATLAYTHVDHRYDPYPVAPDQYAPAAATDYPPSAATPVRPSEPVRTPSFDPGVDLPRFLGSAAATAAIGGILAYVGAVIIDAIATRWVGVDYWVEHGLAQPASDGVLWAWVAAAGAVVAAALMWLLLKITNLAGVFFAALSIICVLGLGLGALLGGPWQSTIGPAALGMIVVGVICILTIEYTQLSVTGPDHY